MNTERLHAVTNSKKLLVARRGLIIEAHPDDAKMGNLNAALSKAGVGLTFVTLTDGAGRKLPSYTPEELARVRWQESIAAVTLLQGAEVYNARFPDGLLGQYKEHAVNFVKDVIQQTEFEFIVVPHPNDPHPDHSAAAGIADVVSGNEIPVYWMDTINGQDEAGNQIEPTHVFGLSQRAVRLEKRSYRMHRSQVHNLPPDEMRKVHEVLDMTHRRGKEFRVRHAAVLVQDLSKNSKDPIRDILEM